jgi:hypothetical protein
LDIGWQDHAALDFGQDACFSLIDELCLCGGCSGRRLISHFSAPCGLIGLTLPSLCLLLLALAFYGSSALAAILFTAQFLRAAPLFKLLLFLQPMYLFLSP